MSAFLVVTRRSVVADQLVFIPEYLLFCLQQLQVGGCGLRHFVVILDFEFACHDNDYNTY